MKSFRNIVFIVAVGVFLCCAIGHQAVLTITGTDQGGQESRLEGRTLQGFPALSAETLASGIFQDEFEQYAADSLPVRELALEANAALQRGSIDASGAVFGMAETPTFFDSSYLYESDVDALVHAPHHATAKERSAYRRFAKRLRKVARAHPKKRFVVIVVAQSDYSASNEAARFYDDTITTRQVANIYRKVLGELPNVTVSQRDYKAPQKYFEHFFRTDNHWNIYGTADAYNAVAPGLGLTRFFVSNVQILPELRFAGAWARQGLYPATESPLVEGNDFSKMTVHERDGSSHDASWQTRLSLVKKNADGTVDDFYVDFYGAKRSAWIEGLGEPSEKALLVGDSYAASFAYPLATQYGTVTTNWSLHGDFSGTETFEEILADSDAEDVFFVANPGSYRSLTKRYPNYWG